MSKAISWRDLRKGVRAVERTQIALAYWESDQHVADIRAHFKVTGAMVHVLAGPGLFTKCPCFLCGGKIALEKRGSVDEMRVDSPVGVPLCGDCLGRQWGYQYGPRLYGGTCDLWRLSSEYQATYRRHWIGRDPVHREGAYDAYDTERANEAAYEDDLRAADEWVWERRRRREGREP